LVLYEGRRQPRPQDAFLKPTRPLAEPKGWVAVMPFAAGKKTGFFLFERRLSRSISREFLYGGSSAGMEYETSALLLGIFVGLRDEARLYSAFERHERLLQPIRNNFSGRTK
jgi:hypothetical protein